MDKPKAVDITPTWQGILPAILLVLEGNPTAEGKKLAHDELKRMAEVADWAVEYAGVHGEPDSHRKRLEI